MARLTSLLLLGAGALVLVTWLVSPAVSSPPQPAAPVNAAAVLPELDSINQEVDRLQARLAPSPVADVIRDPFQFASTYASANRVVVPALDDASMTPVRLAVTWPKLVAILSSGTDAVPVVQAAFEDANHVIQLRSEGDLIDGVRIDRITTDAVTVTASSVGQTTTLVIR